MSDDFVAEQQAELLAAKGLGEAAEFSLSNSAIHIDRPLTNLAMGIKNREYVADLVMPVIKVPKDSDKFYKYDPSTYFEEQSALMTGAESMPGRIRYKLSTGNYSTADYGLMDFVTNREIQNADAPLAPMQSATKIVTNRLLLARERRVATKVFTAANYSSNTSTLSGTTQWSHASSDPVVALYTAIEACDVYPNVLVVGAQVWTYLRTHAKFVAMVSGRASTSDGPSPLVPTLDMVAAAFGLDRIIVGKAKYNTNREGATDARGYVWGKHAALLKVTDAPDARETDTFGYTFRSHDMQTQLIEDPKPGRSGGVWVKVTHADDEEIIAGGYAGWLFVDAVA